MIKNIEQAVAAQARRIDAGKFGFAKAVRRYLRRKHRLDYQAVRASLPVAWPSRQE